VPEDIPPLKAALERALELDPGLPPARLLLAHVRRWEGDLAAARAEAELCDASSSIWRSHALLLQALLAIEACKESQGPIPPETTELYRRAMESYRQDQFEITWVRSYLVPLHEDLAQRGR